MKSTSEKRLLELLEGKHSVPCRASAFRTTHSECKHLQKGQTVPVEMGDLPSEPPPWYNSIKFQQGQAFAQRHFAGISLAHFVSLMTMLVSPQVLKVINILNMDFKKFYLINPF